MQHVVVDGVERLLLFGGDGSMDKNGYVLSVPELDLIQMLDVPGLSRAAESVDGGLLGVRDQALAAAKASTGLALATLHRNTDGGWETGQELELVAGHGVEGARIVLSPSPGTFFIPSPTTGQLFVVSTH